MYIDIHCHLTGGEYEELGGVAGVLRRAETDGVARVVCSGFDMDSSEEAMRIAEQYENVYFTAGFHPSELKKYRDGDWARLEKLCSHEKCIALGEIGLDYHFDDNPPREEQREKFLEQLVIADRLGLPVVLHSRDAAQETLELLKANTHLLRHGGLMHCYSYSAEMSEEFTALGLYFSFGGPSTFKNAKKVWESVQRIPAHRILSETDCPYLTPVPFRGVFPNEPKNVVFVTERLAQLKEVSQEVMQKQIWENARTLFPKLK